MENFNLVPIDLIAISKNQYAKTYYHKKVKQDKTHCESCNKDILKKYYNKHLTLNYHLNRIK